MKFTAALALFSLSAFASQTPAADQEVELLNGLVQKLIPVINSGLQSQVSTLDPVESVYSKDFIKAKDFGFCNAVGNVSYSISHLTGLSQVKLNSMNVTVALKSDNGSMAVAVTGSMAPIDLTTQIDGKTAFSCSIFNSHSEIKGTVSAKSVSLDLAGVAQAEPFKTWSVSKLDLYSVVSNIDDISITLDEGFGDFFNPILSTVIDVMKNNFKLELELLVDSLIKDKISQTIESHLPISLKP